MLFSMLARAEYQADWGALEGEHPAQLVLQVSLVGEVYRVGIVGEEHKRWGPDVRLGGVIELDPLAGLRGRWVRLDRLFHQLVELARGDTLGALLSYLQRHRQHFGYPLAKLG